MIVCHLIWIIWIEFEIVWKEKHISSSVNDLFDYGTGAPTTSQPREKVFRFNSAPISCLPMCCFARRWWQRTRRLMIVMMRLHNVYLSTIESSILCWSLTKVAMRWRFSPKHIPIGFVNFFFWSTCSWDLELSKMWRNLRGNIEKLLQWLTNSCFW